MAASSPHIIEQCRAVARVASTVPSAPGYHSPFYNRCESFPGFGSARDLVELVAADGVNGRQGSFNISTDDYLSSRSCNSTVSLKWGHYGSYKCLDTDIGTARVEFRGRACGCFLKPLVDCCLARCYAPTLGWMSEFELRSSWRSCLDYAALCRLTTVRHIMTHYLLNLPAKYCVAQRHLRAMRMPPLRRMAPCLPVAVWVLALCLANHTFAILFDGGTGSIKVNKVNKATLVGDAAVV